MDTGICDGSTGAAITREQQAELMYKGKKYVLMPIPERGTVSTHAIHGTLFKKCCIERYDVYRREQNTIKAAATTTSTDTEQVVPSQVPESAGADVVAVVTLGSNLDGHNNIVHGGVLALVIDDVLGFGYFAVLLQEDEELRLGKNTSINDGTTAEAFRSNVIAVTANLNINYRAPVPSNSTVVVEATLVRNVESAETRREKNKFHWNVEVVSLDCATTYCQATSLYVIPKKQL
jgi:acyl-coenzyme A thioesterase PaaI-like protein